MGCLLYRLLMGRTPFADSRGAGVLVAHISKAPPFFSELRPDCSLPKVVEWTVRRCLEKEPDQRFASMEQLRNALQICRLALVDPAFDTRLELVDGQVVASESLLAQLAPTEATPEEPPPAPVLSLAIGPRQLALGLAFVAVAAASGGSVAWLLWMAWMT